MDSHKARIEYMIQALEHGPKTRKLLMLSLGRVAYKFARKGEPFLHYLTGAAAQHVRDWISVAVERNEPWLSRVDRQGRPLKLMKFSNLDQMVKEADKAMNILNQKIGKVTLSETDEDFILELEDGYSLVRLRTQQALDREGQLMQHCIGQGNYDSYLKSDEVCFYSLRDRAGKPHATIEVSEIGDKMKVATQLQGKQNREPDHKYIKLLMPAYDHLNINMSGLYEGLKKMRDINGKWYGFDELPDGFTHNGFLQAPYGCKKLPPNTTIKGWLNLGSECQMAENLTVEDSLILPRQIEKNPCIPKNLKVGRHLVVENQLEAADDYCPEKGSAEIAGMVSLKYAKTFRDLEAMTIKGGLKLYHCEIDHKLPDTCLEGSVIDIRGGSFYGLHTENKLYQKLTLVCDLKTKIPEDLVITDAFEIGAFSGNLLPRRLTSAGTVTINPSTSDQSYLDISQWNVTGDLRIFSSKIEMLPENIVLDNFVCANTEILTAPEVITIKKSATFIGAKTRIPKLKFSGPNQKSIVLTFSNIGREEIESGLLTGFNGYIHIESEIYNEQEDLGAPLMPDDLGPGAQIRYGFFNYSPSEYNQKIRTGMTNVLKR